MFTINVLPTEDISYLRNQLTIPMNGVTVYTQRITNWTYNCGCLRTESDDNFFYSQTLNQAMEILQSIYRGGYQETNTMLRIEQIEEATISLQCIRHCQTGTQCCDCFCADADRSRIEAYRESELEAFTEIWEDTHSTTCYFICKVPIGDYAEMITTRATEDYFEVNIRNFVTGYSGKGRGEVNSLIHAFEYTKELTRQAGAKGLYCHVAAADGRGPTRTRVYQRAGFVVQTEGRFDGCMTLSLE